MRNLSKNLMNECEFSFFKYRISLGDLTRLLIFQGILHL